MKIKIEKTGINGEGIGYLNNKPIFIPSTLPGETVEVEITEKRDRFSNGELLRIVEASPKRIDAQCVDQGRCGGCALMITDEANQRHLKLENLKQSLLKYMGRFDFRLIKPIIANPQPFAYRNQAKMPITHQKGKLVAGFYKAGTNHFVPIKSCIVHDEKLEQVKKAMLDVMNRYNLDSFEPPMKQGIRTLICRSLEDKVQATIVTGKMTLSREFIQDCMQIDGLVSLYHSVNTDRHAMDPFGKAVRLIAGEPTLDFTFEGLRFALNPKAFFQLNTAQASQLFNYVKSLIPENKRVIDAYCGVGALSLMMGQKSKEVFGIEFSAEAIKSAEINATMNEMKNCHFKAGDAAIELAQLKKAFDFLVIDPPRSGLSDAMLEAVLKHQIPEIIYVSCNPSTLAKNLATLKQKYRIISIQGFDLFTHTPLLETVVQLKLIQSV